MGYADLGCGVLVGQAGYVGPIDSSVAQPRQDAGAYSMVQSRTAGVWPSVGAANAAASPMENATEWIREHPLHVVGGTLLLAGLIGALVELAKPGTLPAALVPAALAPAPAAKSKKR